VVDYAVGQTWADGACVQCRCEADEFAETGATAVCLRQQCPEPFDSDYVLVALPIDNSGEQCCPLLLRTACKYGNDTHQIGQSWPSADGDPCKTYTCDGSTSAKDVTIQLNVQTCNSTCPTGWEYHQHHLTDGSSTCCGECLQTACVDDSVIRTLDETWRPDACTTATCVARNGALVVETVRESCEKPTTSDWNVYEYSTTSIPHQCCPIYQRIKCIDANNTHEPGSEWNSATDACVTFTCDADADEILSVKKNIRSCPPPVCELGYEYERPGLNECCGRCVQVACVLDAEVHFIGQSWYPDPCTQVTCMGPRGSTQLVAVETQCSLPADCPPENLMVKEGECCPTCNATLSQIKSDCAAQPLPLQETIGYIVYESLLHGRCANVDPVTGLNECSGFCKSRTIHETDLLYPTSECGCCTPVTTTELSVPLKCADGSDWLQNIYVASSCLCQPCAAQASDFKPSLPQTKDGRSHRSDISYPVE